MKILILGGTKFFGQRLAQALINEKHEVYIASRGNEALPAGAQKIIFDRNEPNSFSPLTQHHWDLVYDQICYSSVNAAQLSEALTGKVKHLIYTSSLSTCPSQANMSEEVFDPYSYQLKMLTSEEVSYGEGKRLAEAYYFQKSSIPVTAVRFPIVMGTDDYTQRLTYHVDKIRSGEEVYFPNLEARMGFIHAEDAAQFLKWCGAHRPVGPINAASSQPITMKELMQLIEKHLQKKIRLAEGPSQSNSSPYGIEADWYMNIQKAEKLGYSFKKLNDWLPQLIHTYS